MEERFFLRAFLFRGIFMRFLRDMQMSCKWVSLSIRALLRNLEGFRVLGIFERKEKYILIPFLDLKPIKILNLGVIWNFDKGTGLS